MLKAPPALQRFALQRAALQARCFARDAQRPAVEDILVPDEGLVVLDGCARNSVVGQLYTPSGLLLSQVQLCCACLPGPTRKSENVSYSALLCIGGTCKALRPVCGQFCGRQMGQYVTEAFKGGCRYDANGFTAGAVRVEGAAMCTGGLLTEWRGVARLDDVTADSLALLFAVKPAPGVLPTVARHWVEGSSKRLLAPGCRGGALRQQELAGNLPGPWSTSLLHLSNHLHKSHRHKRPRSFNARNDRLALGCGEHEQCLPE